MREFVIGTRGKAQETVPAARTTQPEAGAPAAVRASPAPPLAPQLPGGPRGSARGGAKPGTTPRPRKHGERRFVVAYRGSFVGFFEAESELTPREAFIRVASDMAARDGSFDPQRLELFRPVLLKNARPTEDLHLLRGKLRTVRQRKRR